MNCPYSPGCLKDRKSQRGGTVWNSESQLLFAQSWIFLSPTPPFSTGLITPWDSRPGRQAIHQCPLWPALMWRPPPSAGSSSSVCSRGELGSSLWSKASCRIRSLERARAGNFLKHKLCRRPERSELVRMHILQETQAEPSLQATQMKLKRARLADDLNEKIAQRPGPMELVEKNILPVDSAEEVLNGGKANSSKPPDIYNFDEDSSDVLSTQQPASQQSPSSTSASPRESGGTVTTSTSSNLNSPIQHSPPPNSQSTSDFVNLVSTNEQQSNQPASTPQPITTVAPSITPGPVLVKQSLPKLPADKSRSKKSKEPKPRVKKLKYHQYIPPDQKQELNEMQMDSAYARLLQQQQEFLQLQILSQQQQQFNYQAGTTATLKQTTEAQTSCSSVILSGNQASTPMQPRYTQTNRKPDHLPANLDEMKVAELKMELKLRSLPVSGTKTDLIERLKMYQENSNIQTAAAIETTAVTAVSQSENIKLTPPVSPIASKVSCLGIEDSNMADSPVKLSAALSPTVTAPCMNSPQRAPHEECPTEMRSYEKDSEKDKRLHEKERQIEELMRKLEREQRLVEELKMQLEVEKRSQQGDSPPQLSPLTPIQVKEENRTPSSCSASCSSPGLPVLVKQEVVADQSDLAPENQFISHQTNKQPESLHPIQTGAQILLPTSLPASAVAIQLPPHSIKLHTTVARSAPGLIQTSGQVPLKIEVSAALQQQCSTQTQPLTKIWRMDSTAQHLHNTFPANGCPVGASTSQARPKGPTKKSPCTSQPTLILQQTKFRNHVSKCKDPPRYEDAVKQTRSMLTAVQGSTAASQQMDDLFDVLIESGEISPFIRQDPSSQDKRLPVTASVTTLPINTVLSRPPPVVQVAQSPAAPLNPSTRLAALTSDTQMETLLDGTLGAHTEQQTLKLIEELHPPMATMEVDLNENTPPSALNLHSTNIDNMDWLDLTLSVPVEGVNPLDISTPVGVFSTDFLDSHDLHLNWD
ncbi:myocardin-related transcription factor B isoform X2 [Micropterus salmoides]|uniref:myocardin-related transcription factor B isoform X2 n=1 Tax=Micropterus salmoides TaxID=27706 RepID=UPI0018EDE5C6|nr:myocardin-related transcription factor B isoform X2 [Micropterus salmoides]